MSRRPRWVQVLYPGLGGHGSVAFSLVSGDSERSYEHFLLFFGIEPALESYRARCAELRIDFEAIQKRPGLDLGAWQRAFRAIERSRPDVVVLHTPSLLPVALAAQARRHFRIVVVEHQDYEARVPRDWLWTCVAVAVADRVVVLKSSAAEKLESVFGTRVRERLAIIENGIDLDVFSPGDSLEPPPPLRIVMASRLNHLRDHATVLHAVAITPDVEFTIAGDGPTRASLGQLATELGIESRVHFVGTLAETSLVELLRGAHAVVHSTRAEMMSTAVMQAMAVGRAVLATDIAPMRELVEDGTTGLFFPLGDAKALAARLRALLAQPDLTQRLGSAARVQACARFDNRRMFANYERELEPRPVADDLACTIVVPTFNRAARIRATIESVLRQRTAVPFELIVVDDGSTDNTRTIVEQIEDPRVRYLYKPNGERGAARNFGVRHARGRYVYFLDSDDLLLDHHISHAMESLERLRWPEVLHSRFVWRGPNGNECAQRYPRSPLRALVRRNFVGSYLWVRRDVALKHPFVEDRRFNIGEDWYLALVLAARYRVHITREATRVVVIDDAQSMASEPEVFLRSRELLMQHLRADAIVSRRFPHALRQVDAELTSVAALQCALRGRSKEALQQQWRAIRLRPGLALERRTIAVVRHAAVTTLRGRPERNYVARATREVARVLERAR